MSWKKLFLLCFPLSVVALGGCLKDTPYQDVSHTAPLIEFGLSPANGRYPPIVFDGDTSGAPAADTAIGLVIASPQVLDKPYTITVAVDASQIAAFNAANGTSYALLPTNLYSMPNLAITIPAGYRIGRIPVTLNLPAFPASHSFALPLTIVNGGGLLVSGNSAQFFWTFDR
ncbi:MAG TPA: DUF1735 domain-containing protein [Puia sp.]|nr:DUF1735 domain-containing protein [Puia sp.]